MKPTVLLCLLTTAKMFAQEQAKVVPAPTYMYEVSVTYEPLGPNLGKRPNRTLKNVYGRNAEGIRVWGVEVFMFVGRGYFFRELSYPEGAKRYAFDLAQSVTTVLVPGMVKITAMSTAAPDLKQCMAPKETLIGEVKLFGIRMYRLLGGYNDDAERTVWPEGGCTDVESVITFRDEKGVAFERTTVKLNYLNLDRNPPKWLFEVPDSFTEESQSEARAKAYATVLPSDKVQAIMKGSSTERELEQYRKYGPVPGGAAEEFVKSHGFRLPDPNSAALKSLPPDPPVNRRLRDGGTVTRPLP